MRIIQVFYYREPLGIHQVTAAKTLYPGWYKGMHIMLEAFIQKDRKYLRIQGLRTKMFQFLCMCTKFRIFGTYK